MKISTVSVIIPSHNRRSTLNRAIESVKSQSFSDWQLWLVDDGSEDGSGEWFQETYAREMESGQFFYLWQENKGVSSARNQAAKLCQSPWLAFLDSDDEWLAEKLEKQMNLAKKEPHLPLIHSNELWVRRGVRVNPMRKHQKQGGRIFRQCLPLCCISPSTSLIQRDLFLELGGFREDFPVCEDYELWLRICAQWDVGYIEEPLIIKYGGHEDQLSRRFKAMDYWRVKALAEHLSSPHLSLSEHQALRQVLLKKGRILLKGYQKHNNMTHFEEVSLLLTSAMEPELDSTLSSPS